MSEHFNQLTPEEAERLAMLAEEAAEVIQVVGKILRHGYGSKHPDNLDGPDNRAMLRRELADLQAVTTMMTYAGDLPGLPEDLGRIGARKLRYTHHQTA